MNDVHDNGPRARRRRRTAADIVDAAEALVLAGDPGALTVHAVARALDLTPGALYRYFPGIDAIVAQVQVRVLADLLRAVGEAREGRGPLERLVAASRAVWRFAAEEPGRYALLSRLLAEPRVVVGDEAAQQVLPVVMGALQGLLADLAEARSAGLLSPGDDRARLLALWAAVHGAVQVGKLARFAPEARAEVVGRSAVEALLRGWGAEEAAWVAAWEER